MRRATPIKIDIATFGRQSSLNSPHISKILSIFFRCDGQLSIVGCFPIHRTKSPLWPNIKRTTTTPIHASEESEIITAAINLQARSSVASSLSINSSRFPISSLHKAFVSFSGAAFRAVCNHGAIPSSQSLRPWEADIWDAFAVSSVAWTGWVIASGGEDPDLVGKEICDGSVRLRDGRPPFSRIRRHMTPWTAERDEYEVTVPKPKSGTRRLGLQTSRA